MATQRNGNKAAQTASQPAADAANVTGQSTEGAAPAKNKFGITTETKSKNLVPFQPTDAHPITLGYLMDVYRDEREMKDKTIRQVVVFEFKDIEKTRTHFHTEWDIDDNDKDFQVKMDGLNGRLKHIYEEFASFPVDGIGTQAQNWNEFWDAVVDAFNTSGKDGAPIYKDIKIWIKVSYNLKGGAKSQLGFPLSPNFIERYKDGKASTLWINKKYETLKQPEAKSAAMGIPDSFGGATDPNVAAAFPKFPGEQ